MTPRDAWMLGFACLTVPILTYFLGWSHTNTTKIDGDVIETDVGDVVCYESTNFGFICSEVKSQVYFYVERLVSFLGLGVLVLGIVSIAHIFSKGDGL